MLLLASPFNLFYNNNFYIIMKKISLLTLSFFIAVAAFGQAKKITLEESVLQQNRQFRADKLLGFQWIPNTNSYIYFEEGGRKLMKANAIDTKANELVTLSNLNQVLQSDLKSFFGFIKTFLFYLPPKF